MNLSQIHSEVPLNRINLYARVRYPAYLINYVVIACIGRDLLYMMRSFLGRKDRAQSLALTLFSFSSATTVNFSRETTDWSSRKQGRLRTSVLTVLLSPSLSLTKKSLRQLNCFSSKLATLSILGMMAATSSHSSSEQRLVTSSSASLRYFSLRRQFSKRRFSMAWVASWQRASISAFSAWKYSLTILRRMLRFSSLEEVYQSVIFCISRTVQEVCIFSLSKWCLMQPLVSQMGLAERQVMQLPSWMARRVCSRQRVFSLRYITITTDQNVRSISIQLLLGGRISINFLNLLHVILPQNCPIKSDIQLSSKHWVTPFELSSNESDGIWVCRGSFCWYLQLKS